MFSYTLAAIFIVSIIILISLGSKRTMYLKDLAFPILCVIFILALIFFSKTAITAALKGLKLFLEIVLPSLFPFFVVSELLNSTGFVRASGILLEPVMRPLFNVPGCGSFALLMGVTSGYPVGARVTGTMLENKDLTKNEAERLLAFTNNSGPLFIIGAVATGMYGIPAIGYFLLACHIAACVTVGLIFRFNGRTDFRYIENNKINVLKRIKFELAKNRSKQNIAILFGDAVKNSIYLIINIGAFIIFFAVIIAILLDTGFIRMISIVFSLLLAPLGISPDMLTAVFSGFFEITTGTNLASQLTNINMVQQLTITSIIIGWAGLSVHSQVYSIVGKSGISLKPYLLGKFLQGAIAGLYTFICMQLDIAKEMIQPVMGLSQAFSDVHWLDVLIASGKYLLFVLIIYLLFCSVAYLVKRFSRKT